MAPILTLQVDGEEYDLYTDASYQGLEVILMQNGKVITHASCQLKDYENKCPTHNLELVVVFILKNWCHYLYGMKTNVYIDHKTLKYFFTQRELNMQQHQWLELVKDYDMDIRYHLGKAYMLADALSGKLMLSQITTSSK